MIRYRTAWSSLVGVAMAVCLAAFVVGWMPWPTIIAALLLLALFTWLELGS